MALGEAPERMLAALAGRCATGMHALPPSPKLVELGEAQGAELSVTVDDPTRCLRVLAAGGPGVADLELSLVDTHERALGQDELEAPFALVAARGPICPDGAGVHRARLRVRRGRGAIAFGVFAAD
jgi:hypothetical protein